MLVRTYLTVIFFASICSALPLSGLYARALNILGLATLEPNILTPGNSLINANVLANVLSPSQCSGSARLGVQANLQLLNLLNVCACVEAINTPVNQVACPPCPANASPICASGTCGCTCNLGYYAASVNGTTICVPGTKCPLPNQLIATAFGTTNCVCARGFVDDYAGGCISACLVIQ